MTILSITKTYQCAYSDTDQVVTYVEWVGADGKPGRTEGQRDNPHMSALLNRAMREGVSFGREIW